MEKVTEVVDSENNAFRDYCRDLYAAALKDLGITLDLEGAVFVMGGSPAKKYTGAVSKALETKKAVIIAGRGEQIAKCVSVAEQVKKDASQRVVQLNKASLHPSLLNPSYKASASTKNVEVYFGGINALESSAEGDALREIKGHKVYQVPALAILLVSVEPPAGKLATWSKQTKN